MGHTVSVLLDTLAFLDPDITGLAIHGANLITAQILRHFAASEFVDSLEVFLPPALMLNQETLATVARAVLPPVKRGRGAIAFYPFHSIPEVWADGKPRILFCIDPERLTRDRYLRDRFATGPMPITCDTHALGHHRLWNHLVRIAGAPPVAYDCIACISHACMEGLRRSLSGFLAPEGTPLPCRLDLMYHGCDINQFAQTSPERRNDCRRILRLPQNAQITLFLGRLTPNSKADLLPLLNTFARVSSENDYLVIAGIAQAPGYIERLRETGDEVGLGDRLIIRENISPGFQQLYYCAADLFVFPGDTIQESLANTVIEAMACGLPVIISDWDGMRDLVQEGETGYKVPCYWMPNNTRIGELSMTSSLETEYLFVSQSVWVDTGILADRLRTLLRSPELRVRLGNAGRKRIEDEFAINVVMNRWNALWSELLVIAARETQEDAQIRRTYASSIGLPTPYLQIFDHYATGVFSGTKSMFRLNELGRAVLSQQSTLRFYDDTLPLLRQDIIDTLFDLLDTAGTRWSTLNELCAATAAVTGKNEDDIRYHLGLLLKRDLLEFTQNLT